MLSGENKSCLTNYMPIASAFSYIACINTCIYMYTRNKHVYVHAIEAYIILCIYNTMYHEVLFHSM